MGRDFWDGCNDSPQVAVTASANAIIPQIPWRMLEACGCCAHHGWAPQAAPPAHRLLLPRTSQQAAAEHLTQTGIPQLCLRCLRQGQELSCCSSVNPIRLLQWLGHATGTNLSVRGLPRALLVVLGFHINDLYFQPTPTPLSLGLIAVASLD